MDMNTNIIDVIADYADNHWFVSVNVQSMNITMNGELEDYDLTLDGIVMCFDNGDALRFDPDEYEIKYLRETLSGVEFEISSSSQNSSIYFEIEY